MMGNVPVRRNCDLVNADEVGESIALWLHAWTLMMTRMIRRVRSGWSAALLFSALSIWGSHSL